MPRLADYNNPYASLNQNIDAEEDIERHAYLKKLQNPYAALAIFGEDQTKAVASVDSSSSAQLEIKFISPQNELSKSEFRLRVREILLPYEPLRGTRRVALRSQFRAFIQANEDKPSRVRAAILRDLQRYDLSSMGALNPHLNREGSAILSKLDKITNSHPA